MIIVGWSSTFNGLDHIHVIKIKSFAFSFTLTEWLSLNFLSLNFELSLTTYCSLITHRSPSIFHGLFGDCLYLSLLSNWVSEWDGKDKGQKLTLCLVVIDFFSLFLLLSFLHFLHFFTFLLFYDPRIFLFHFFNSFNTLTLWIL